MLYITVGIVSVISIMIILQSFKDVRDLSEFKKTHKKVLVKKNSMMFIVKHVILIALGLILCFLATYVPWFTGGKDATIYQIMSIALSVVALVDMITGRFRSYVYYDAEVFYYRGKTYRLKSVKTIKHETFGYMIQFYNGSTLKIPYDFACGLQEVLGLE